MERGLQCAERVAEFAEPARRTEQVSSLWAEYITQGQSKEWPRMTSADEMVKQR